MANCYFDFFIQFFGQVQYLNIPRLVKNVIAEDFDAKEHADNHVDLLVSNIFEHEGFLLEFQPIERKLSEIVIRQRGILQCNKR